MRWLAAVPALQRFLLPPACLACRGYLAAPDRLLCPGCTAGLPRLPHPRCPRCHAPRPAAGAGSETGPAGSQGDTGPEGRCRECEGWPPVLQRARQATALEGPARALVHALKYEGWEAAAAAMAADMVPCLPEEPEWGEAVLVPVPTTPEKIRRRGYNQAGALTAGLARRTGRSRVDALLRRDGGTTQVALHPDERRANVRGAFEVAPDTVSELAGRRVILVDDVLTTGATGAEAAEVLEGAGAPAVWLCAFARTLPDRRLESGAPPGATGVAAFLRARGRRWGLRARGESALHTSRPRSGR